MSTIQKKGEQPLSVIKSTVIWLNLYAMIFVKLPNIRIVVPVANRHLYGDWFTVSIEIFFRVNPTNERVFGANFHCISVRQIQQKHFQGQTNYIVSAQNAIVCNFCLFLIYHANFLPIRK